MKPPHTKKQTKKLIAQFGQNNTNSGLKLGFLKFSSLVYYFPWKLHRTIAWDIFYLLMKVKPIIKITGSQIGSQLGLFHFVKAGKLFFTGIIQSCNSRQYPNFRRGESSKKNCGPNWVQNYFSYPNVPELPLKFGDIPCFHCLY